MWKQIRSGVNFTILSSSFFILIYIQTHLNPNVPKLIYYNISINIKQKYSPVHQHQVNWESQFLLTTKQSFAHWKLTGSQYKILILKILFVIFIHLTDKIRKKMRLGRGLTLLSLYLLVKSSKCLPIPAVVPGLVNTVKSLALNTFRHKLNVS